MNLIINNDFIKQMYSAANNALKSADLSKEDSVIHSDEQGTTISGHKWVTLGGRSRDFKAANKRTRELFFENITSLFGGKSQLPSEVLKEFKMEDFKLDGFGKVKSERPLTARRIIAICEKANKSIEATIGEKIADLEGNVGEYVQDYNGLSGLEQDEYRAKITEKIKENPRLEVSELCVAYPPGKFVTDKICNMLGKLKDCEGMDDFRGGVRTLSDVGAFEKVTLGVLESVRSMLNDCLELGANALKRVNDKCPNRSLAEKVFLFNKFVTGFVIENLKKLGIYECRRFSASTVVNECSTFEKFADAFDFKVQISEDDLKKNDPLAVYRFMRACVDQHKTEYSQQEGGKNSQLLGNANKLNQKSKYENIVETIKQSRMLVDNKIVADGLKLAEKKTKIFKEWYVGNQDFCNWVRNSGKNNDAELRISKKLMDEYRKEIKGDYEDGIIVAEFKSFLLAKYHVDEMNAEIAKEGEQLPPFPLAVTTDGKAVAEELGKITGVGSHEYDNTVDQFQLANEVFSNIHTTFMKCLEKDAKNGNTECFDRLMDAMNMPGCLQFRMDPILNLKTELELGADLNVDTVSKHDDVVTGFAKKINEMRKNLIDTGVIEKEDAIQYSVVVDGYIESVGDGTEIKLGNLGDELKNQINGDNNVTNFFEESKQMDDLMNKGSVKVSKEFFNLSPVKKFFLDWFGGYVEAEGKEVGK